MPQEFTADAFIAHVNGSAFVRLPDGSMARFGYAGTNGREYTSLGKELIEDGLAQAVDVILELAFAVLLPKEHCVGQPRPDHPLRHPDPGAHPRP